MRYGQTVFQRDVFKYRPFTSHLLAPDCVHLSTMMATKLDRVSSNSQSKESARWHRRGRSFRHSCCFR